MYQNYYCNTSLCAQYSLSILCFSSYSRYVIYLFEHVKCMSLAFSNVSSFALLITSCYSEFHRIQFGKCLICIFIFHFILPHPDPLNKLNRLHVCVIKICQKLQQLSESLICQIGGSLTKSDQHRVLNKIKSECISKELHSLACLQTWETSSASVS